MIASMHWNWSTHRIASILGMPTTGKDQNITRITTDSRSVKPGDLFVAIRGDAFDGHDFIPDAVRSGAIAILTERDASAAAAITFKVPDTLRAIRTLAHAYRKQFNIPLIGVVGAVGKTTTKELISSLLLGRFKSVLKTEGSQNGFLGIPLTLLQLKAEHEVGVIEIGIDEIGAMDQHLALVEPTHLILTRTGPEHLHQLKTVEIAAQEELRAFDYGLANSIPLAINLSDPFVKNWYESHLTELLKMPHPSYSLIESDQASVTGHFDAGHQRLSVRWAPKTSSFSCPLPGEHHAHNLLAAIVVARLFNLSDEEIALGISRFKTASGRTEIHSLPQGIEVIGDHYNSNPTSLDAALRLLTAKPGSSQTHAVLGDMLELGDDELRFHREVSAPLRALGVTHIWLYGPRMKALESEWKNSISGKNSGKLQHFDTHESLVAALLPTLEPGARILVKGSRGMKMEKVLNAVLAWGKSK